MLGSFVSNKEAVMEERNKEQEQDQKTSTDQTLKNPFDKSDMANDQGAASQEEVEKEQQFKEASTERD
jgi:hypothetical protein